MSTYIIYSCSSTVRMRTLFCVSFLMVALGFVCCIGVYYNFNGKFLNERPVYLISERQAQIANQNRLSDHLIPVEYRLTLKTYLPSTSVTFPTVKNFTFEGEVTIKFRCQRPTRSIALNADRLTLLGENGDFKLKEHNTMRQIGLINTGNAKIFHSEKQIFVFQVEESLAEGEHYELRLKYTGHLSDDIKGYYKTRYMDRGKEKWLAVTQFQPTDARRAMPCFDEPRYKAVLMLTMIHPENMKALANARERTVESMGNGWSATHFHPTPKMSTYLFAFFVGEYAHISVRADTAKKTEFRIWTRPELVNQTKWAAFVGPKILEFYESYFGVEFPLEKQDLLAVPQLSFGAMENWGLVTYRESQLLYEDGLYPLTVKQSVASVVAHELAHQWFGDLVTMDWWDDLWLNEGFASYMEYMGTDEITDYKFGMCDQFPLSDVQRAMKLDQMPTSHPIYVSVSTPNQINEIFDDISYRKASAVLSMLNHTVGHDVFRQGLHDYLSTHKFGSASHFDLCVALQKVVNDKKVTGWRPDTLLDVTEFVNRWILQMNFPLISARRVNSDTISAQQSRFLAIQEITEPVTSPYGYKWFTPLWYTNHQTSQIEMAWLNLEDELLLSSPAFTQNIYKWYLLDPQVSGMYRVNYDYENWSFLQKQLQQNAQVLGVKIRAQILDDALTLAKANVLTYDMALNMTLYLWKEGSYIPWGSAMSSLHYIGQMLSSTSNYGLFKNYMLSLVTPMYKKIDKEKTRDKDDVLAYKLKTMLTREACNLGQLGCTEKAAKMFDGVFTNCSSPYQLSSDRTCNILPADLRGTVYCEGVNSRGQEAWDFLYLKYQLETVSAERESLLEGLCCTKEPWLVVRLLDESIKGGIARSDAGAVYSKLAANPIGKEIMWPYMVQNWENFRQELGTSLFLMRDLVTAVTSSFNTQQEYDMVKGFMDTHADLGTGERAFHQQLSMIRMNIQWMKNHAQQVIHWLRRIPNNSF